MATYPIGARLENNTDPVGNKRAELSRSPSLLRSRFPRVTCLPLMPYRSAGVTHGIPRSTKLSVRFVLGVPPLTIAATAPSGTHLHRAGNSNSPLRVPSDRFCLEY